MELPEGSAILVPKVQGEREVTIPLHMKRCPLSLTAGIYKRQLVCDLTKQEEDIMDCVMTTVADSDGSCLGAFPIEASGEAVVLPEHLHGVTTYSSLALLFSSYYHIFCAMRVMILYMPLGTVEVQKT
jgi:exosome complex RNA-binding protein Rrp42 (RNase PH superfamily)